jgi:long-chain acyl-CoA synthetase
MLDEVNKGKPDDLAIICYTSGTTGNPKGVMLLYEAVVRAAKGFIEFEGLTADEEVMAYLPMAWIGDHVFCYAQALVAGFTPNCPEDTSTVVHDRTDLYLLPPKNLGKLADPGHDQDRGRRLDQTQDVSFFYEYRQ